MRAIFIIRRKIWKTEINSLLPRIPNQIIFGKKCKRCHERLFSENCIQNNKLMVRPKYIKMKGKKSFHINLWRYYWNLWRARKKVKTLASKCLCEVNIQEGKKWIWINRSDYQPVFFSYMKETHFWQCKGKIACICKNQEWYNQTHITIHKCFWEFPT